MAFVKGNIVQIKASKIIGTIIGAARFKDAMHYGVTLSDDKSRVITRDAVTGKYHVFQKHHDIKWCLENEIEFPKGI